MKQSMKSESAVVPASRYDWYTFNGARGVKIKTARGREAVLRKGSKFGVRAAGKNMRLITEETGASIVFSVEEKTVTSLVKRSVNNRKTPSGKGDGAAAVSPKGTSVTRKSRKRIEDQVAELSTNAKIVNAVMPQGHKVGVTRAKFMGAPLAQLRVRGKSSLASNLIIHLDSAGKIYSASWCPATYRGDKVETWPVPGFKDRPLTTKSLTSLLKKTGYM
jgi:hypothetical protein